MLNNWILIQGTNETKELNTCIFPDRFDDNYCDDENNTAECGFDGGDCCDKKVHEWDSYCDACRCKGHSGKACCIVKLKERLSDKVIGEWTVLDSRQSHVWFFCKP